MKYPARLEKKTDMKKKTSIKQLCNEAFQVIHPKEFAFVPQGKQPF